QRRKQMPLDMVDRGHRDAEALREPLGAHQADQQRADQSRTAGHRDTAKVAERASRCLQRLLDHGQDGDDVVARGQFRNDAAVTGRAKLTSGAGSAAPSTGGGGGAALPALASERFWLSRPYPARAVRLPGAASSACL